MSALDTSELVAQLMQSDLKSVLDADDAFSDVEVITEDEGNVLTAMDKALGIITPKGDEGRYGVCVIVKQPTGIDNEPGLSLNPLLNLWEFLVLEHRETNINPDYGTGKRARAMARRIHRILKGYCAFGLSSVFTPQSPCIVPVPMSREINEKISVPLVAYAVRFKSREADMVPTVKVQSAFISATPALTNDGGGTPTGAVGATVTLTSATSGALVYYTTDLSHPCAQNLPDATVPGTATLYTGPFTIDFACILRTRAHKTGCVGSDTMAAKFV